MTSMIHLVEVSNQYFHKVHIPVAMVVVMSWVSFWINPEKACLRIIIIIAALTCIIFVKTWINIILPMMAHSLYVNIYMDICLLMVFITLVEFFIVIMSTKPSCKEMKKKEIGKPMLNDSEDEDKNIVDITTKQKEAEQTNRTCCPNFLDRCSRFLFPTVFILVQILSYWFNIDRDYYMYPVVDKLVLTE
jgi:predicted membrane protein